MKNFVKIGDIKIGDNFEPQVIAEIGINHGGSLKLAKKMAKLAIKAGVKIIKHQTHIIDDEMTHLADKKVIPYIGKTIYKLMEDCSLNENDEFELKRYIEKNGGIFLSTPFSRKAVDRLNSFDVSAFKIGSGECNNYPLIEYISSFKKPVILSTGMNDLNSIKISVKILKKNRVDFILMHTTNIYPTPYNLVRLGALDDMKKKFHKVILGLSDHTISNLACYSAVAKGACIVERHFTDTKKRKGPDIKNSMDYFDAKELVSNIKLIKKMTGGQKKSVKEEGTVKNFAFASVCSIKRIKKGEKFSHDNLWLKRPGNGPYFGKDFKKIIDKITKKNINIDQNIKKGDF